MGYLTWPNPELMDAVRPRSIMSGQFVLNVKFEWKKRRFIAEFVCHFGNVKIRLFKADDSLRLWTCWSDRNSSVYHWTKEAGSVWIRKCSDRNIYAKFVAFVLIVQIQTTRPGFGCLFITWNRATLLCNHYRMKWNFRNCERRKIDRVDVMTYCNKNVQNFMIILSSFTDL